MIPLVKKCYLFTHNGGIAALFTIVVIGSAVLLMSYASIMRGIGELDMGFTAQRGGESFALADGCVEEALRRLRLNPGITSISLSSVSGTCTAAITSSGNQRSIIATAIVDGAYYKRIQVTLTLSGNVITSIDSWQEVSL